MGGGALDTDEGVIENWAEGDAAVVMLDAEIVAAGLVQAVSQKITSKALATSHSQRPVDMAGFTSNHFL